MKYSWGTELASSSNPFTSLKFREAFAYAFNYTKLLNSWNKYLAGKKIRLEGIIPKGMLGHHDTLIEDNFVPTTDIELSKQLLTEVGWKGTIVLGFSGESAWGWLLGLFADYITSYVDKTKPISWIGWSADFIDPHDYVYPFYYSKGHFSQFTRYENQNVDRLMKDGIIQTDDTVRSDIYKKIEENVTSDYIFMYLTQDSIAVWLKDWIHGLEPIRYVQGSAINGNQWGIPYHKLQKYIDVTTSESSNSNSIISQTSVGSTSEIISATSSLGMSFIVAIIVISPFLIRKRISIK